jgi:hypothetical protein
MVLHPHSSVRKWDPNMAKTRPMNQEDNQAPQPTGSERNPNTRGIGSRSKDSLPGGASNQARTRSPVG